MKTKVRAFSLTELLVVIGILAVLVAVLLPVFFKARTKAHATQCAASLRQIGVALQSYLSDHDGVYPPTSQAVSVDHVSYGHSTDWRDLLVPYTKTPFPSCPDRVVPTAADVGRESIDPNAPEFCGYAYNINLASEVSLDSHRTVSKGQAEPVVRMPALTVAAFDARYEFTASAITDKSTLFSENVTPGAKRHLDGANYLFADGHVKWFVPGAIRDDLFDMHCDGVHPGFGL